MDPFAVKLTSDQAATVAALSLASNEARVESTNLANGVVALTVAAEGEVSYLIDAHGRAIRLGHDGISRELVDVEGRKRRLARILLDTTPTPRAPLTPVA